MVATASKDLRQQETHRLNSLTSLTTNHEIEINRHFSPPYRD
jgi:hypothetical protein